MLLHQGVLYRPHKGNLTHIYNRYLHKSSNMYVQLDICMPLNLEKSDINVTEQMKSSFSNDNICVVHIEYT